MKDQIVSHSGENQHLDQRAVLRKFIGHTPMRWQCRLLSRLCTGDIPTAIDLPTGLGKTSVMAIWLAARAFCEPGAPVLPRRLVYVVDRRAVVDQATEVANSLAAALSPKSDCALVKQIRCRLDLPTGRELPVSTLRGQRADNREWFRDPAAPAIIVGTVDMIGSRLLFEGYGLSRRMRPLQAGLLGQDTLVVLDEAHLVPPFEALLHQIATGKASYGAKGKGLCVPPLRLLPLSATMRNTDVDVFNLEPEDDDEVVQRRIRARKALHPPNTPIARKDLARALADRAWALSERGRKAVRIVVFCDRREDAAKVAAELQKSVGRDACELLVGERRAWERERVAQWIADHGFQAGSTAAIPTGPAFLVATSAGEVGIDLDADHMVADVVEWERMVQRLGRVNRRGDGDATIEIVRAEPDKPEKRTDREVRAEASASLLTRLPEHPSGGFDASPAALIALKADADAAKLLAQATTPSPLRPALSRALVDAWSLTSLEEHTGRPEIGPWLRGWVDEDVQTTLIWRHYLPWRQGEQEIKAEVDEFFEHAAPERVETLEAPAWRALEVLRKRAETLLRADAKRQGEPAVLILTSALSFQEGLTLGHLRSLKGDTAVRRWADRLLVVAATLGGLSRDGLLDDDAPGLRSDRAVSEPGEPSESAESPFVTLDGDNGMKKDQLRILRQAGEALPPDGDGWKLAYAWPLQRNDEEGPVEEIRVWGREAERVDPALSHKTQSLADHTAAIACHAEDIARRIGLDDTHRTVLVAAARLHDLGKRREAWQDAFGAPRDAGRPYAKTNARWINKRLLNGYRHEFGSLADAAGDEALQSLPQNLRDLALHLIVAHHGEGRPIIRPIDPDAPPSMLAERAREVALRFARLQRRWGPWGLAWWEALLRAADAQASRDLEEGAG